MHIHYNHALLTAEVTLEGVGARDVRLVHMLQVVCNEWIFFAMCAGLLQTGGCVLVQFNPITTTFDCPCHGSWFDCYGKVCHGPAKADLQAVELKGLLGVTGVS